MPQRTYTQPQWWTINRNVTNESMSQVTHYVKVQLYSAVEDQGAHTIPCDCINWRIEHNNIWITRDYSLSPRQEGRAEQRHRQCLETGVVAVCVCQTETTVYHLVKSDGLSKDTGSVLRLELLQCVCVRQRLQCITSSRGTGWAKTPAVSWDCSCCSVCRNKTASGSKRSRTVSSCTATYTYTLTP